MKTLLLAFLILLSVVAKSQDNSPTVVNISDNPALQYNGASVKQKATVLNWTKSISKDFTLTVVVTCWTNLSGSYGVPVIQDIASNVNLSADQISQLSTQYADRVLTYTTVNAYVDSNGNPVSVGTPGAQPALQYWQSFKVNQVPGFTSASTLGALAFEDLIIQALISKLNSNKKW